MADSTAFLKIAPDPRSDNWEHNNKKLVICVVYWTTDSKSFILSMKNQPKNNLGINYYVLGHNRSLSYIIMCVTESSTKRPGAHPC